LERIARGRPRVAVAQEPLERVRGLEADALHVERELALRLAGASLLEEVDLVVEEQRLEMLLDADELPQALEGEIAVVLAELADRGEELAARPGLADGLEGEDAFDVRQHARHVSSPAMPRRRAARASGWGRGRAPGSRRSS